MNMKTNNDNNTGMAHEAISPQPPTPTATASPACSDPGEPSGPRYAEFRAAIEQLRKAAVTLDDFDLQVKLKWKRDPWKSTPPPDKIKFPELPRYVTDEVAAMVRREEQRQKQPRKMSPGESMVAECKAYASRRRTEQDAREEMARIAIEVINGTIDENDESYLLLKELRELAGIDKVQLFPSSCRLGL